MKLYTLFIKTFLLSRLIRTKPFTVNWLLSKFYTPKELRIMGPEYDSINENVFTKYKKLTNVTIVNTSITKLPNSLCELENLNSLLLIKNKKLTDFSQLEKLKNNEKFKLLQITNTTMSNIPESVFSLAQLVQLSLHYNEIVELPSKLFKLNNLKELRLTSNKISKIPSDIQNLKNLNHLYLSNNLIMEIPEELFNLTELQTFSFANNSIEAISDNIKNLNNLKVINLANNNIKEIPESLLTLKELLVLNLSSNSIEAIPDNIKNLINLRNIILANNKIKKIPEALSNLTELQLIDFSNNLIEAIPDNIENLINLMKIYIGNNKIKEIPEALFKLKSLSMLDLSFNYLKLIPESIGNLKQLEILNLAQNQINMLPNNFTMLNKLWNLDLQRNNFVIIPNEILKLKKLKFLDLSNNEISKIPSIIKMSRFKELNLSDNFILKEYLCTTSDGRIYLRLQTLFNVILGDQHKKTTFEEVIQSLKKEKYYWNIDELAKIKHTEDVLERAKHITDKQMRKMWREVLKHLIYKDPVIDAKPHDPKNNEWIDFDTESNEEVMTSASSLAINTANQRNNETDQLKVIDATNSPCNSENLITICDTDELNTTSSITKSIASLIENLKTKLKQNFNRKCNKQIHILKRKISIYLRTISSENDENSLYIKSYLKLLFYEFLKDLESGDDGIQESIEVSLITLVKYNLVNCNIGQIEGAKHFYNCHCLKESQNHNAGNLAELIKTEIARNKEVIFSSVTLGKYGNVHYTTRWRPYFKDRLGISQSIKDTFFDGEEMKYELRKGEILDIFFKKFKIEKMVNEIMASINSSPGLVNESLQYLKIAKDKETEANLKKNDDRENELYLNYNKTIKEYFEYTLSSLDEDEDVENSTFCHTKIKYTGVLKILMLENLVLEGGDSNVENIEIAENNASISAINFDL